MTPATTDGRLVRYVMLLGGDPVNVTLIREGYATAIRTFPYALRRECLQLEAQARRSRWANRCTVIRRWGAITNSSPHNRTSHDAPIQE